MKTKVKKRDRLYKILPKVNFIIGMGSVLNIQGNYFKNSILNMIDLDGKAIENDWVVVGNDLHYGLDHFINENRIEIINKKLNGLSKSKK